MPKRRAAQPQQDTISTSTKRQRRRHPATVESTGKTAAAAGSSASSTTTADRGLPSPSPVAAQAGAAQVTVAAIADTHGVLDDDLLAQLRDAAPAHLLHMGDVGDCSRKSRLRGLTLLERLSSSLDSAVPITAVAGNVDEPDKALMATLGHAASVEIAGWRLLLVHGHAEGLQINAHGVMDEGLTDRVATERADAVLFGHSHKPLVARQLLVGDESPPPPQQPTSWPLNRSGDTASYSKSDRGALLLNPGSAGPRRFKLPRCWFLLRLYADAIEIERRDFGAS